MTISARLKEPQEILVVTGYAILFFIYNSLVIVIVYGGLTESVPVKNERHHVNILFSFLEFVFRQCLPWTVAGSPVLTA